MSIPLNDAVEYARGIFEQDLLNIEKRIQQTHTNLLELEEYRNAIKLRLRNLDKFSNRITWIVEENPKG